MENPALLTLRVLEGPDKGRVFQLDHLPASIGREPQNVVALRDERVSRYHCRLLLDAGDIILADFHSTNGTRLNGQALETGILHPGDVISVGQTLILVGTRPEIINRLRYMNDVNTRDMAFRYLAADNALELLPESLLDEMADVEGGLGQVITMLHALCPPELPKGLTASQTAHLSELLLYIQLRLRPLIESATLNDLTGRVSWSPTDWQSMLDLYARINDYHERTLEHD